MSLPDLVVMVYTDQPVLCVTSDTRGVIAAGTGARRMLPTCKYVHLSRSSSGWVMDSSHSPLRVSVTEQAVGVRTHRPLPAKSVASDGNTQIMRVLLSI